MLSLAEEICLLSLIEKKETLRLPSSLCLSFTFAGAALIDLVLLKMIKIEDGRIVPCIDSEQVQDAQMKQVLEKLRQAEKHKKLDHWVYLLGGKGKRITKEIGLALVEKDILLKDGQNFRWTVQQPADVTTLPAHSKYLLKRDIRDAVFCQTRINERLIAIIRLMDASSLLGHLFTSDEMVFVRRKMKSLKREAHLSPGFSDLLEQMVDAIDYAVAAAIMK